MIYRLRRRLSRLRVTQRLALLVLVPLIAVVGLAIPVVTDRVDQARAQASISDQAETRRNVGVLLEELQRERLLSLLYLALDEENSNAVVRQSQAVNDAIEDVRANAEPRLRTGVDSLVELLNTLRPRVLDRSVLSQVAHTLFSRGIAAVIDSIPPPAAAGREAVKPPAAALDELLRANEQASRYGAAVLVIVTEPATGKLILADAKTALDLHTARFTQLASVDQRNLLTAAETSQASQKVTDLATNSQQGSAGDFDTVVGRTAAAVETYTTLRRLVGDRIAREITDTAAADAQAAFTEAILVGLLALVLLLLVAGLAAAGARSIAVPLAQLNVAAVAVAAATGRELERVSDVENQAETTTALRAVPTTGPGDVADLAAAFNQVQESAAALLARQVTTRRNVSAMFATVARRTRNLADRQLNLIDVLERQQQDPQLLERLYRLDHVATRLRRSASALLVVSGAADDPATGPMRLADVVRAAAAEIEQFTRVRLEDAIDVAAVPRVVSDLILLVAEVLDNAVSYSPPPGPVTVSVSVLGEGCRISIADVGIGMSADQLAAENKRLIDRERLEIAPTRVLGLFVVGRIARRHGLTVTLQQNLPQGVLANIDLPARLLTAPVGVTAPAPQPRGMRQAVRATGEPLPVPDRTARAMEAAAISPFDWFGDPPMLPAGTQPAIAGPVPSGAKPATVVPVARGHETVPLGAFGMPRAGRPPGASSAVPSPLVPPSVASGPIVPAAASRPSIPPLPVASAAPPAAPVAPAWPVTVQSASGAPSATSMPSAPDGPSVPPVRPGSLRDRPQLPGDPPTGPATSRPGATPELRPGGSLAGSGQPGAADPMAGAAAQPNAGGPGESGAVPIEERGGLSRRVPGRHLPSTIAPADRRDPAPIDPMAARAEAEAFSQGFARGVASVPGAMGPSESPATSVPPPTGGPQPPQWPLSAAIPAQRAPHAAERIDAAAGAGASPGPVDLASADTGPLPAEEPAGATPASNAPVSGAPTSGAPISGAPVSGAPVSGAPVSGAPVSGAPVSAAPAGPIPVTAAPVASTNGTPTGSGAQGVTPTGVHDEADTGATTPTPDDAARYPLPQRRVPGQTARNGWAGETTQPAPTAAQPPAAVPLEDDGRLTRRVPGSHLANELRMPGAVPRAPAGPGQSSRAMAPSDRDPQAEQLQLNALVAGFARGDAASEAGSNGVSHQPPDPSPSYQYDSGTPNGAEPQNVERR